MPFADPFDRPALRLRSRPQFRYVRHGARVDLAVAADLDRVEDFPEPVVRLLLERGARLDVKDALWQGTPAGWARHEVRTEIEKYLQEVRMGKDA
jgi:hypothetical protein